MGQILNGKLKANDADSYAYDVGVLRHAISTYDFSVSGGAQGAFTIFTITGDVMVSVFGCCKTDIGSGGAATIELGITGNTAILIAQTGFDDLDQYETWQDNGPEANPGDVATAMGKKFCIQNGLDVLFTVATADLNAGVIDFHAFWYPITTDGNLVAA